MVYHGTGIREAVNIARDRAIIAPIWQIVVDIRRKGADPSRIKDYLRNATDEYEKKQIRENTFKGGALFQ